VYDAKEIRMKRLVFSLLFLLGTVTGCPPGTGPTGTPPGGTTSGGTCTDGDLAARLKGAVMPPVKPWQGEPIAPPSKLPARAFLFESPGDQNSYGAVIVDGEQVTARYELPASSLGKFISLTPDAPAGNAPLKASPTVKVGGPPRPMSVVVPAPPPVQTEDALYWLILACLQQQAEARAAAAIANHQPPP
jgi:hypothetical protein